MPSPERWKPVVGRTTWCSAGGGEEFVILLPHTSLDTALQIAESIRAAVARITIPGLPRFTVSIGVARHNPGETIDELFKRVDDALYRAKNDGRNKVLAA